VLRERCVVVRVSSINRIMSALRDATQYYYICANAIAAIKLIVSTIGALKLCSWFRDEMDKIVGLRVLFAIC
jgi:hypothetical protein